MGNLTTAAILTIGDELMIGQTVDTNSSWISSWLDNLGWRVVLKQSVGDDIERILEAIRYCHAAAGLVITSGGLGPTNDDLTIKALCKYYDCKSVWHEETWIRMKEILRKINREASELHRQQCYVPEKAEIIPNDHGSAPGFFFSDGNKMLISVPGVPYEMRHLLSEKIHKLLPAAKKPEHRFVRTCGEGETVIADVISDIEAELPDVIRLAYLPSYGQVTLRLSAFEDEGKNLIDSFAAKLEARLGKLVYATGDGTLSQSIGKDLRDRGETLALAESCTGGYLSHLVTAVPGSSDYFIGSLIPYAYRVKTSELDISERDLLEFGAVSKEVVTLMSDHVRKKLNVTWSLATSGIAGPGGGTPEKPAGTIWIACSGPDGTETRLLHLSKDRVTNIEHTAIAALLLLRKCMIRRMG